jgi:hypothetical protein
MSMIVVFALTTPVIPLLALIHPTMPKATKNVVVQSFQEVLKQTSFYSLRPSDSLYIREFTHVKLVVLIFIWPIKKS